MTCPHCEALTRERDALIAPLAAKIEIAAVHHCCLPSNLQEAPPFSEWCRLIKTWPDEGFAQQFDYECLHCHQKIIVTLKPGLAEARAVVETSVSEQESMMEQNRGPLERLMMLHRHMGNVRSLLDRVKATRTKDHDDQDRTLGDWQAQLSIVLEQLATGSRGALLGPAGPPDWQPIETAPKDGREILGYGRLKHIDVIHWSQDEEPGWTDGEYTYSPTHWMPLPAPPAGTGE